MVKKNVLSNLTPSVSMGAISKTTNVNSPVSETKCGHNNSDAELSKKIMSTYNLSPVGTFENNGSKSSSRYSSLSSLNEGSRGVRTVRSNNPPRVEGSDDEEVQDVNVKHPKQMTSSGKSNPTIDLEFSEADDFFKGRRLAKGNKSVGVCTSTDGSVEASKGVYINPYYMTMPIEQASSKAAVATMALQHIYSGFTNKDLSRVISTPLYPYDYYDIFRLGGICETSQRGLKEIITLITFIALYSILLRKEFTFIRHEYTGTLLSNIEKLLSDPKFNGLNIDLPLFVRDLFDQYEEESSHN